VGEQRIREHEVERLALERKAKLVGSLGGVRVVLGVEQGGVDEAEAVELGSDVLATDPNRAPVDVDADVGAALVQKARQGNGESAHSTPEIQDPVMTLEAPGSRGLEKAQA
jgi:hypothetical protein